MSHKNLVAFIIGAGPNVGAAVGAKLKENGYEVALGSRDPKALEGYFPVKVDVYEKESILAAFETVTKTLGPVYVVIYNAATLAFPPKENDILSLTVEEVYRQTAVGINVIAAAQAAVAHFRDPIHKNHPKAFIVTGNPLPFSQAAPAQYFTLGLQKTIAARLIANATDAYYPADGIKFYFASLFSKEGGYISEEEFLKSGPTHAKVYWGLINDEKQGHWDYRFTLDTQLTLDTQ